MHIPSGLRGSSTGLCAAQPTCTFGPSLPYEWCEGEPDCLPSTPADALFSSARLAELEAECSMASGSSRRLPPTTCHARPGKEVDFGFVTPDDGPSRLNPPVRGKWVRNLGISNGRHSGSYLAHPSPTFVDLAQWPTKGTSAYKWRGATDGFCHPGAGCGETYASKSSTGVETTHTCSCSNNVLGGCGGAVDDVDCPYDYTIREAHQASSTHQYATTQACWDWCTAYINDGANRCSAREKLANGGQIYCGYKTGRYTTATTGIGDLDAYHASGKTQIHPTYSGRCNVFVSDGLMRTVGPFGQGPDGGDGGSAGPYLNYVLSANDGIATGTGIDGLCAPDESSMCAGSGVSLSDAQTACSAAFDAGTDESSNCVYDVCVDGCIECQVSPDGDDPGPALIGNLLTRITFGLTIAGDLSDVGTAMTSALKDRLIEHLSCLEPECVLTLTLAAASVDVEVTMRIPSGSASAQATVDAALSSAQALASSSLAALTALLGVVVETIRPPVVQSGVLATMKVAPPPPSATLSAGAPPAEPPAERPSDPLSLAGQGGASAEETLAAGNEHALAASGAGDGGIGGTSLVLILSCAVVAVLALCASAYAWHRMRVMRRALSAPVVVGVEVSSPSCVVAPEGEVSDCDDGRASKI